MISMQHREEQIMEPEVSSITTTPIHGVLQRRRLNDHSLSKISRVLAYKGASDVEDDGKVSYSDESTTKMEDMCTTDSENSRSARGEGNKGDFARRTNFDRFNQTPQDEITNISFGALMKARTSLGIHKNLHTENPDLNNDILTTHLRDTEDLEVKASQRNDRHSNRPSKHAPTELSSRKAVSRRREVISIRKQEVRDPRFEPIAGSLNRDETKKNYAFLNTYRDTEIAELKAELHKTKDPSAKETFKRALTRMESHKKAKQLKEQQQEVLRQHRKEERKKVEKGKRPFHLKRAELRERALVERFKGLNENQVNKVIERRRKRQTAKERKGMPEGRRG